MQIRKRNGKWSVQIRRRGFKNLYKTFKQKSDALKWSKQTEVSMDQSRFKDTTNASKTTLKSVLERHLTVRISVVRVFLFSSLHYQSNLALNKMVHHSFFLLSLNR